MSRAHVWYPNGRTDETLCRESLTPGELCRYRVVGRICRRCRRELLESPQLLWTLWRELVAGVDGDTDKAARMLGGPPAELVLTAIVSNDECGTCSERRGRPHRHNCVSVTGV
jgi:hypothetical protein